MTFPEYVLLATCGYVVLLETNWRDLVRAKLATLDGTIDELDSLVTDMREVIGEVDQERDKVQSLRELAHITLEDLRRGDA